MLDQVMERESESENSEEYSKGEDEQSTSEDRIHSSSSPASSEAEIESEITDFSFDDIQLDRDDKGSISIDNDESDAPETVPDDDASTLESPPVQVMERPAGTSGYRIPSYVFATNKANHPEWSTTSNESLFSIHTGNMSFTRDQFSWLLKSGELGIYGGSNDVRNMGELPPPSPTHVPKSGEQPPLGLHIEEISPESSDETLKSGEEIIAAHFNTASTITSPSSDKETDSQVTSSSEMTETTDSETEGKKYDAAVDTKEKVSSASDDAPFSACISHHSDTSCQSFAFPVLAEVGRDKSVNSGQSHIRADLQKNSSGTDQEEASGPPKTTPESSPSFYSWFSSCFSSCYCCKGSKES